MSESINDVLHRVDRAIENHIRADQTTRTVKYLTDLEKQIAPYIDDLDGIVASFGVLNRVGKPAKRPQTRVLSVACRQASGLVRQDKTGPRDLPRTLRQINDVVNAATATARDAWREFIDEETPGLDSLSNLAEMLSQIQADRNQAATLRKGVVDLRFLSRRLPDKSAPGQAAAAAVAIRTALAALLGTGDADNEEVRTFLEGVAHGGAHVRTLTPAVRDWMRRSKIEDSFKIVAGRPAND